jgi:hypothetical protein
MNYATRLMISAACLALLVTRAVAQEYSAAAPPGPQPPLPGRCYTTVTSPVSEATVLNAIHIKSAGDLPTVRAQLATHIWGSADLPTAVLPDSSITQTTAANAGTNASGLYGLLSNASTEQRLNVNLGPSFNSIIYEWTPKNSNGRLYVLHDGHANDSYNPDGSIKTRAIHNSANQVTINSLLGSGYTVLWVQMPLFGDNLTASAGISLSGCPRTSGNAVTNLLKCSDRHGAIFRSFNHPLRFFIEPVIVAINTALAHGNFKDVSMMGASGGGWTTVVAAAVDPRITTSVSVAGSLPLFLPSASDSCRFGRDAEQTDPQGGLYQQVSYLDLYILDSARGPGGGSRLHQQINNQFDVCCFYGINYTGYVPILSKYIAQNNLGNYEYQLDNSFVGHGYNFKGVTNKTLRALREIP